MSKIEPVNDHMAIWDQVSKTDPEHTRQVQQRGGYTAIDPGYQLKEATRLWGPYGRHWGLSQLQYDYELASTVGLVVLHARFYYPGGEFPISNAAPPTMGKKPDPDFAKKLETNTMSKALSKLGFNADVFMGQFEDAVYLQHRQQEAALDKAADQTKELAKQQEAYEADMANYLKLMGEAVSTSMLKPLFTTAIRKAKYRNDKKMIIQLTKVKDQRKAELEKKETDHDSTV